MSDVKKIATRESYGKALAEFGDEYKDLVVLDADLANATKTQYFKEKFPERHIDCGIAESNMTGIAAGLAAAGKIPFISSFAMFAAGRNYEQVRNSIGYPKLNVKIGATHAGITVGEDGATHQCLEDVALMRTIPGMTVIVPSDDVESKAAVKAAIEMNGPVYLRFSRAATPVINDTPDFKFEVGKGITVRDGKDLTIIACGVEVCYALEAAEKLAAEEEAESKDSSQVPSEPQDAEDEASEGASSAARVRALLLSGWSVEDVARETGMGKGAIELMQEMIRRQIADREDEA